MLNSKIIGHGHYLPSKILKNDDFKKFVDTSDEWIFSRTGIKQRYIVEDGEASSDISTKIAEEYKHNVLLALSGSLIEEKDWQKFSSAKLISGGLPVT